MTDERERLQAQNELWEGRVDEMLSAAVESMGFLENGTKNPGGFIAAMEGRAQGSIENVQSKQAVCPQWADTFVQSCVFALNTLWREFVDERFPGGWECMEAEIAGSFDAPGPGPQRQQFWWVYSDEDQRLRPVLVRVVASVVLDATLPEERYEVGFDIQQVAAEGAEGDVGLVTQERLED